MIRNNIELKADWKKVDKLIENLNHLKETKSSIDWLSDDWKKDNQGGIMDTYLFDYEGINYESSFARAANKLIIEYIES